MKRNLLRTFMVLLAIAAATIGPAWGQSSTSTLTFTGAYGTYGATADDEVEWTVTSDGAEKEFDHNKGIHYGSGTAAVQYIELSTSGITGTITQVKVNASTASGVTATVSVTVGGNAFGGDPQGISNNATDYTFTGSASGAIVVRVAKPSAATKALYVKSIEVTYTPASSGGGSTPEPNQTTYNVTFGGFGNDQLNTMYEDQSLPLQLTFDAIDISEQLDGVNEAYVDDGAGAEEIGVTYGPSSVTVTINSAFNGTATIIVDDYGNYEAYLYVTVVSNAPAPTPHTVRFASGNDGWTMQDVTASASATAPAVLQNVMAGDSLVVTYSGTRKVKSVKAVKYVDPMTLPLTIEALNNGTITVQGPKAGMQYSLNGAAKAAVSGSSWSITVAPGDKVSFYGNGTSITSYYNSYYNTNIKCSEGFTCKVYGNIMSLVDEENFATATTLTANLTFANLFQNNTSLVDASNLMLPATTLAQQCYSGMFYGCSSLTAAPALPATTLKSGCYSLMFNGCRALIAAPALPATTLDQYCYSGMFSGCSALIAAPALPATTLDQYCYNQMFYGCSSLTAAPALPATTLAQQCYYSMFQGCTGLTAAPVLPATTLATECYGSMFAGDNNLTSAPALPATTLAQGCYYNMFYGCSGLTAAPALPATTLADNCYAYMFQDCTGLTAAPALPATTLTEQCYNGMFYGCSGLTAAPVLPATTLANNCYNNMFNGCSMLSSVTCLATDISAFYCTDNWLTGVAATGTFITPSSTNWSTGASTDWPYGYSGIPDGWTRVNADE